MVAASLRRCSLLLLDEPSMGLAPAIADLIFDRITALHREDGVTLLLVEQRVAEALESCDYGYVLETGRVVLEGPRRTLMADDRVRQAYLGMGGQRRATAIIVWLAAARPHSLPDKFCKSLSSRRKPGPTVPTHSRLIGGFRLSP